MKSLPGRTILVRIMEWEQGRKAGLGEVKGVPRVADWAQLPLRAGEASGG